jgi:hypothetical protein
MLVITSAAAGELAFWAAPGMSVITYSGSAAARSVLHDHELWLQPSSMDGKVSSMGPGGRAALPTRIPKPDIVITSYEVVCSDVHALSAIQVRMRAHVCVHVSGEEWGACYGSVIPYVNLLLACHVLACHMSTCC